MQRPSALLLAAALLAATLHAGAAAAPAPPATEITAPVPLDALAPWWSGLGDATLDRLLQDWQVPAARADRARLLELQARACVLYLGARIEAVRGHTAIAIRHAAQRRLQLLQELGQGDMDTGRAAEVILRNAVEHESRLAERRRASAAELAAWMERPLEEVAALLAPVLGDPRAPLPAFEIPTSLPGLVLRRRADVASAEAELLGRGASSAARHLQIAEYLQALSHPIAAGDVIEGKAPQDRLGLVLRTARGDVGSRLAKLALRAGEMQVQASHVQLAASQYLQVLQGFREGTVSELDMLSGLHLVLAEQDELALVIGRAALAWIVLQQGIGGAGEVRTSDLLGAGSGPAD